MRFTSKWSMDKDQTRPQHRELRALLFTMSVWVLLRPLLAITVTIQEMGPTVYRPYPRRLQYLTICRSHCKGSIFSSDILTPWVLVRPVWGSNPRPPSRKSDALPTEVTGRRKCRQGDETVFWGNSVSFSISWGSRYESLLASSFSSSNQ